jgi:predicted membrane chloride channel (bestrophin family)
MALADCFGGLSKDANDKEVLKPLLSRKHTFKDVTVVGAYEETQIVNYDQSRLSHLFALLSPWSHGSIFRNLRIWCHIFLYWLMTAGIAILFYFLTSDPAQINVEAAADISTYFNMFLPFLFGIYLNNIFNRWWTMRADGVGGMNQALNSLSVIMGSQLQEARDEETKHLFLRYSLLSHELVYRAARKTDADLSDLVESGALKVEENEILQDLSGASSKAQAIWVWIQVLWDKQLQKKRIPSHVHWNALNRISDGRTALKRIFTILSTQLPFAYVHLMAVLVHLNLVILAFQAGTSLAYAVGLLSSAYSTPLTHRAEASEAATIILTQLVYLTVVPMVYLGFLELTQEIADPFGMDANDFPRAHIHNTMQDENESFFSLAGKVPNALTEVLEAVEGASKTIVEEDAFLRGEDNA